MTRVGNFKLLLSAVLLCSATTIYAQSETRVIPAGDARKFAPASGAPATMEAPKTANASTTKIMSTSGGKFVVIKGTVKGDTKGHNQIYYYSDAGQKDSVSIVNGRFTVSLPADGPYRVLFFTQYETAEFGRMAPFPLLIDQPGVLNIDMNIQEGFRTSQLSGISTTVAYSRFMKEHQKAIMEGFQAMHSSASGQVRLDNSGDQKEKTDSMLKSISTSVMSKFVKEHNNSFVAAYVISENKPILRENVKLLYNMLSSDIKNSEIGKDLFAFTKSFDDKVLNGDYVQNFTLPDDKGKNFSFSQLSGKYVWVDFWASWCQPCKAAFPAMRKLYEKYKNKNLEILAISIDQDKQAWLKAVKAANNPWIQIWDNTSIASQFAVTAVPRSFLIAPDGKIILSEVGFDTEGKSEMEKKLEEVLGNK